MKIVVCTRTLNEEKNISSFCKGYSFANLILLIDGGSTDKTKKIAKQFPNVKIVDFNLKIILKNNKFMNPEPEHMNFLINCAKGENADWIIYDGCDSKPNKKLKQDARRIIRNCSKPAIYIRRIYMWMENQYFPKMGNTGGSFWAWRKDADVFCDINKGPFNVGRIAPLEKDSLSLGKPYCLLHNGWSDKKTVKMKMRRYASWGRPQVHPLKAFGPAASLERWMK